MLLIQVPEFFKNHCDNLLSTKINIVKKYNIADGDCLVAWANFNSLAPITTHLIFEKFEVGKNIFSTHFSKQLCVLDVPHAIQNDLLSFSRHQTNFKAGW